MADKVKALKMENSLSGGTQNDGYPVETDPLQDYLATKGIAYENLDTFLTQKLGRTIVELFPSLYQSITYSSGIPQSVAFYNSSSFVTANRIAQYDFTYTSGSITTETLKIFDVDGSTVLRTYTWNHTYTSGLLTSSNVVIT